MNTKEIFGAIFDIPRVYLYFPGQWVFDGEVKNHEIWFHAIKKGIYEVFRDGELVGEFDSFEAAERFANKPSD